MCVMKLFRKELKENLDDQKPWEHDQALEDPGPREIFYEYLEMRE